MNTKHTRGQFANTKHYPSLGIVYLLILAGFLIAGSRVEVKYEFISPLVDGTFNTSVPQVKAAEPVCGEIDCWIDKYANKFGATTDEKQQIKVKLHFLAYRESRYGLSEGCGDSGKACGFTQFWAGTWTANRKRMLDKGLITEIGDRLNVEQAIETTAWMLSIGQDNQWGPLKRQEIEL